MNALLIRFPRERAIVRAAHVGAFAAWRTRWTAGLGRKARRMAAMLSSARPGAGDIDRSRLANLERFGDSSWMLYEPDGGRLLVADVDGSRAIHVQLKVNPAAVRREVAIRQRAGRAAPEILFHDPEQGVIAERWERIAPATDSGDLLRRTISALKSALYAPTAVNLDEYVRGLGGAVDGQRVTSFMAAHGVRQVELSHVHGDLWPGNLGIASDGSVVLLDWEYARDCGSSHDLWTYLAQSRRSRGLPFDSAFFTDFANGQRTLLAMESSARTAEAFHLLHLVERYTFFRQLDLDHKRDELRFLRGEIDAVLARQTR